MVKRIIAPAITIIGGGINPLIWYLVNDLVRAHRGLGCMPIKILKIAKRMIKVIILTTLETFLIPKRVMAVIVTMK